MIEQKEKMSKIMYNWAQAIKALADAEAAEAGPQLERYKLEVQEFGNEMNFFSTVLGQLGDQGGQSEQGNEGTASTG